jgi:hypothetical protein
MVIGDHREGFEKEAKKSSIYAQVREIQEALYMHGKFMEIAMLINPELFEGAFKPRPCRRKLRYIGYDNWPEPTRSEMYERDGEAGCYFAYGGIYYSLDFTGATYSFKDYVDPD